LFEHKLDNNFGTEGVLSMSSWTSTSYFSNLVGSCVTSSQFLPIHCAETIIKTLWLSTDPYHKVHSTQSKCSW
jgi:hypothetical protein